jgi:hypothetical protein
MAQLIKTKGWVFVDDNQLHITVIDKPYWVESKKYWRAKNGTELLPRELFPDMKQEDTPIEVEITVNSIPNEDLDIDEELQRFFETEHLFVDVDDLLTVRHSNGSPTDKIYYFEDIARHFAQWQKEKTINKACQWLQHNAEKYVASYGLPNYQTGLLLHDFKHAMEDNQ